MYGSPGVKTDPSFPIPDEMRAWILGSPDELTLGSKPVPVPLTGLTTVTCTGLEVVTAPLLS